ncbi:hypothetical protein GKE29_24225 [Escherichia coli]|uniref:Uncharacterized protein n=1 Tax=Akkermansia muciniphila TaxID=239935 RepID=A0A2N8HE29_9BACT|nr:MULTISPECIES: hypothetical protein [Akkermansia]MEE0764857.1 hypothetical protein [Akkermansia sp.]MSD68731.1 hypothetical protein [Escherichia coli]MSK74973.1 hypothetical protein [Escherichia coli]PNC18205.1 hypothetical protein CXU22_06130 [Akkermansia muciniphila]
MKEKSIKQPWPRSAKITVWVLVVLLALFAVYIGALNYKLNSITNSDEYIRDHILIYTEAQYTPNNEDIPMETPALLPTEEDAPDLHKIDFEYPALEPTT